MTSETILFIILAFIVSAGLAFLMYGLKPKSGRKRSWLLGLLRFVTFFCLLLLLINPKFENESYTVEKPKLPVLIDNSASVSELGQSENVRIFINDLKENEALNDKFELSYFAFGERFGTADSLSFSDRNTNISAALSSANSIFKKQSAPTILITDGNQTFGTDYEYSARNFENQIFPVILGDSTKYLDLKIEQLNTNRYVFLKNSFPVEIVLVYSGTAPVTTDFQIKQGNGIVHREKMRFTETENARTLLLTLPATAVGLQQYTAEILPLETEKNTANNSKQFAVEVIDQATKVLVVSKIVHPDLGLLKKSITSNEQRSLEISTPEEAVAKIGDSQLVVLYQPDRSFATVFSEIKKEGKNIFVISGTQTDWNFLNRAQEFFEKNSSAQTEEIGGKVNLNYGAFAVEDLGFEDFPPLKSGFGTVEINVPHETLLSQEINGFSTGGPLLATMEANEKRYAVLDGEGLWKWRAQSFLESGSFETFDQFLGKLVQYLASNKRRSRLETSFERFYYNNGPIKISAQYFDKNFVFDPRASLSISLLNTENEQRSVFPLLLKNNFYEVDLSNLPAGNYDFKVSVKDEPISRDGSFSILDFNVEQQFLNADVPKLERTAQVTEGTAFFISETDQLIKALTEDERFHPIQKKQEKTIPLIDWKYLLALLVLSLSAEWFIRKYRGLV